MHDHNVYDEKEPCCKCGYDNPRHLQQHHVYPQRFTFARIKQDKVIWLCKWCHFTLECIIEDHEKQFGDKYQKGRLKDWVYPHLVIKFLTENTEEE